MIEKTIGQCLHEQALQNQGKTALEMEGLCWTFGQMDRITDRYMLQMSRLGIRHGIHVGIWCVNSANWVFTFLALVKMGAVPVLINTCYKQEEIKGILNYADVEVLYYGDGYKTINYEEIVNEIRKDTPNVRLFIHLDEHDTAVSDESLTSEERAEVRQIQEKVVSGDIACMIFTSGTTSLPKGVLLSHYNLVNNSRAMVEAMHWETGDRMCITVPMFHCFGITAGIVSCVQGGISMYLLPYFKTKKVWEAVTDAKCTILNGVPSMFLAMIRKPEFAHLCGVNLKSGIIAGSPVTPEAFQEICARFPGMHLQPSYGQTEASPCVTIADWDASIDLKTISAGRAVEHVEVRIADPETGEIPDISQAGEIQVRGYNVMVGYYKLPKATEKAFTMDGWLKTGDIGKLDEQGNLFVTGRLKEMIIRAGENIAPQEIEQVIRQLPWVADVKVIGVPSEVMQEEIAACVIPKPGCSADEGGLKNYVRQRLAHYKVPAYVTEMKAFPLNASGKIHLKVLKEIVMKSIK